MLIALRRLASLALGAVVLAVVLFSLWPVLDLFSNQVTVYPVWATEEGKLVPANRTVYKVFPETQTVVHWAPGVREVPDRLAKCAVRDRLNWHCEYSDGSGVLTMENGSLKDEPLPATGVGLTFTYVGRIAWWKLALGA